MGTRFSSWTRIGSSVAVWIYPISSSVSLCSGAPSRPILKFSKGKDSWVRNQLIRRPISHGEVWTKVDRLEHHRLHLLRDSLRCLGPKCQNGLRICGVGSDWFRHKVCICDFWFGYLWVLILTSVGTYEFMFVFICVCMFMMVWP